MRSAAAAGKGGLSMLSKLALCRKRERRLARRALTRPASGRGLGAHDRLVRDEAVREAERLGCRRRAQEMRARLAALPARRPGLLASAVRRVGAMFGRSG